MYYESSEKVMMKMITAYVTHLSIIIIETTTAGTYMQLREAT